MKNYGKKVAAFATSLLTAGTMMTSALPLTASADGDNNYAEALALSLYFYDANECGSAVNDGPLTWRGNCHTEDGKLKLSNATNFDNSLTSLVDPDGDGCVDMSGGYHDAGDHIKFNLTMGFGFSSLAMSEYLNPGAYEKAGCKDHLLSICKKNADYMMKSTFLDNSGEVATICYVVADGGVDHSMMTPPEEQHYDRASYWLTRNSNNSACCGEMAAALAGCAYLYKDVDANYSKECLKYAKAIYNFGMNHRGNYTSGQAPYYSTADDSQDELLLASAWLYICGEGSQPSTKPSNGNYNGKYDCYRYTWDKVYQGYAA
nr:glycoside hydrolase family 9 protein [Ruminococcus sp.]